MATNKPRKHATQKKKAVRAAKPEKPRKAAAATAKAPAKVDMEAKRREAYRYYVEHQIDQKEISKIIKVSEQTITKWKTWKGADWDADRQMENLGPDRMMRRVIQQFDAKLKEIEERDVPVANSTDTDVLNKLADSVKKLQKEIMLGHKTEVGKQFIQFILQTYGKEKSIELLEYWHEFIMATGS